MLFIQNNGLHHPRNRRRRCVKGAARLQQVDNLRPTVHGARHQAVNCFRRQEPDYRDTPHGAQPGDDYHVLAVFPDDAAENIRHRNTELGGDKAAQPGAVEHPGQPQHPVGGKPADLERQVGHDVYRVGHHDDNAFRRVFHHLTGYPGQYPGIGLQQFISAHARLPRQTRSNHHHVRVRCCLVAVGAGDASVDTENGCRLHHIQRLALLQSFYYVNQHDVGTVLFHQPLCRGGADTPRPDDADFGEHTLSLQFPDYGVGHL